MNAAESAFDTAAKTDRFVCLLAGAREVPDVVAAVRDYLATWPPEQVAQVQKVDAGWAPFDEEQKPTPVDRPADVHNICDAVHGQCSALRGAGLVLAPELLELDLVLFFACTKLEELEAQSCG